jgi:hypothetical protein
MSARWHACEPAAAGYEPTNASRDRDGPVSRRPGIIPGRSDVSRDRQRPTCVCAWKKSRLTPLLPKSRDVPLPRDVPVPFPVAVAVANANANANAIAIAIAVRSLH